MKSGLLFKVLFMMIALIMVIFAIRGMNEKSMEAVFDALGIEPGTAKSPGFQPGGRKLGPGEERFNICRTRVHAIVWPSGRRVEEFREGLKLRWLAVDPRPREIGYLEVEKWLSAHCQVVIKPVTDAPKGTAATIEVRYIDEKVSRIKVYEDAIFDLKEFGEERLVRSDDLRDALLELQKIAIFDPVSGF